MTAVVRAAAVVGLPGAAVATRAATTDTNILGSRCSGGSWRTSSPKTRHGRRTKTRKAELEVLEEPVVKLKARMPRVALVETVAAAARAAVTDSVVVVVAVGEVAVLAAKCNPCEGHSRCNRCTGRRTRTQSQGRRRRSNRRRDSDRC